MATTEPPPLQIVTVIAEGKPPIRMGFVASTRKGALQKAAEAAYKEGIPERQFAIFAGGQVFYSATADRYVREKKSER